MSRPKLSAGDKRIKLLEIFHESGDVFQLKDLEKLAPKTKGIVMQSVKPVLQELVDSGDVRLEKISGSLFYWSFPSDSLNGIHRKLKDGEATFGQLNEKISVARTKIKDASELQINANEVDRVQEEISQLNKEKQELEQKLRAHDNDLDIGTLKVKQQDATRILEAANRWTDNIFSIKTWCKQKFDKEDRELDKAFGIPEDFDYLDV